MLKDYFFFALSNLKHRGLRSWLTMLGIFIGIAAVVSLISLGQGLEQAVIGQFTTLSADKLIVQNAGAGFGPPGSTVVRKLTEHDKDIIKSVEGVDEVIPRLIRSAKVEYNDVAVFNFIGSLPKEQKQADFLYETFSLKADKGKLLEAKDRKKVLLGSSAAKEETFGKDIRIGAKLIIQGKEFEVSGILKEAGSFQFNSAIFLPEDDMKEILGIEDEIDILVVKVKDSKLVESVADEIERKLRKDRDEKIGEEDFSVQTPLQFLDAVKTILNIINLVVAGIAAISLLVGGIGIANTMYTSVLERTKEIGTMKAVGAKNKDVLLIFLIESGLLGAAGGIIGVVLGIGLAFTAAEIANSAFGSTILKVQLSLPLVFAALAFSFLMGIGSGILPALQASKLKPVEALRK